MQRNRNAENSSRFAIAENQALSQIRSDKEKSRAFAEAQANKIRYWAEPVVRPAALFARANNPVLKSAFTQAELENAYHGLIVDTLNTPAELVAEIGVLTSRDATPAERLGAFANFLIKTGIPEEKAFQLTGKLGKVGLGTAINAWRRFKGRGTTTAMHSHGGFHFDVGQWKFGSAGNNPAPPSSSFKQPSGQPVPSSSTFGLNVEGGVPRGHSTIEPGAVPAVFGRGRHCPPNQTLALS